MSNNSLRCPVCKCQHHPVECPAEIFNNLKEHVVKEGLNLSDKEIKRIAESISKKNKSWYTFEY